MWWCYCPKNWKDLFWQFFNSLAFTNKFFEDGIYAIGIVRPNRTQMRNGKKIRKFSRVKEISIILQTSFAANGTKSKPVLLLATNADGMSGVSNKMRQTKGSPTKTSVSCRNIIKLYNNGKGGVDIIDQKTAAYRLDRKSKYVDNVFWSHRYRTCKQSCCLRETW